MAGTEWTGNKADRDESMGDNAYMLGVEAYIHGHRSRRLLKRHRDAVTRVFRAQGRSDAILIADTPLAFSPPRGP